MDELRNRLIQIYDEYRTALLNGKYYARRLALYRNLDLWSEIVAALGTSSAIGSWALWKTTFGANGWTLLAGAAVIVSLLKPIPPVRQEQREVCEALFRLQLAGARLPIPHRGSQNQESRR